MPAAPEVLTGMRAPRAVRMEAMAANAAAAAELPRATPSADPAVNVYVSRYRRYCVQITAPQSYVGLDGRKVSGGEPLVAQFEDGVFRNDHRDLAARKLIDETLRSNPYFGPFGSIAHFWLSSDQNAQTEAARVQAALDTLRAMPKDALDAFVRELKQGDAEDHELPATPAAAEPQRAARPIPAPAAR